MKAFKDFNIKPPEKGLTGDKIKIKRILNKPIIVHRYEIAPTKYKESKNPECLSVQFEMDGVMHIVFTGSRQLMETIKQVPLGDFPFKTTIVGEDEGYLFT
jgi:hypothetical protein